MGADHMLEEVHHSITPHATQQLHAHAELVNTTTAEPEATTTKYARIDWLQQLVLGDGSDGEDNDTVRNEAAKVILTPSKTCRRRCRMSVSASSHARCGS
jgi:hypothetical protein